MKDGLGTTFLARIRALFSFRKRAGGDHVYASDAPDLPKLLDELRIDPENDDDFDKEACERLIVSIRKTGVRDISEIWTRSVAVTLEDFFVGNRSKGSIAANVLPSPPFDTMASWFDLLRKVRATPGVTDVLVGITMIEPFEDGRVRTWPYSDTIWVYSSLDRDKIASLIRPLQPDEVLDASIEDQSRSPRPPQPAERGVIPYRIWWD